MGTLAFCRWDYKIEQSVGKIVFQRLMLELRYGPEIPLAYVFNGPNRTNVGTLSPCMCMLIVKVFHLCMLIAKLFISVSNPGRVGPCSGGLSLYKE